MKLVPYVDNPEHWLKLIRAGRQNRLKVSQTGRGCIGIDDIKEDTKPVLIISPMTAVVDRAKAQLKRQHEDMKHEEYRPSKEKQQNSVNIKKKHPFKQKKQNTSNTRKKRTFLYKPPGIPARMDD
ncbi:unnamed protein product [Owenia fusiformis]|uniref:Uncharacterized protein n=1 Tax=Owenia fusiformis TaxID=6347 RepID=A0A8S4N940_OWEFU|nr:unnamed protein product [Owenia fusiformis]